MNDRLEELAQDGASVVVVAPIGFVSDHMEVVYDLDTEAAATAERLGLRLVRVPTVGIDPEFVSGLVDLVRGARRPGPGRGPPDPRVAGSGTDAFGVCPRVLSQPARAQAGPLRAGLTMDLPMPSRRRHPRGARGAWPSRSPWRPAGSSSTSDPPTWGFQDQEHRDRRGDGDGPAGPGPAPHPAAGGPPPGRLPRRGGGRHRRALRDHLGRRPHRRHRQLPLQHPFVCRVRRRRGRRPHDPGRVAPRGRRGGQPGDRRAVPRPGRWPAPGCRADGQPRAASSWPMRRPWAMPWWAPASATTRRGGSGRRPCC